MSNYIMTAKELVDKLKWVVGLKTLYVKGGFGLPLSSYNKTRLKNQYEDNRKSPRVERIDNASYDTFAFDCVGLVKGILWGFSANTSDANGGCEYQSNNLPDNTIRWLADNFQNGKQTNMSNIEVGEAVVTYNTSKNTEDDRYSHIGIYIGDGLIIECDEFGHPTDNVRIRGFQKAVGNYPASTGNFKYHGKLHCIEYGLPYIIAYPEKKTEDFLWKFLKSKNLNDNAAAAVMGCIYHASRCCSAYLSPIGQTALSMSSETYTKNVCDLVYRKFNTDGYGYGIMQWKDSTRKLGLYNYAKNKNVCISNLQLQMDYMWNEIMNNYQTVYRGLFSNTTTIDGFVRLFLHNYYMPANQGSSVENLCYTYANNMLSTHGNK